MSDETGTVLYTLLHFAETSKRLQ